MKLVDLLINQKVVIQFLWDEQKIEFSSTVVEKDASSVYVTPYIHNGSELELNIVEGKGVICNLFTEALTTQQRLSWKNIELTTVVKKDKVLYCLRTYGFNTISKVDDRRQHERIIIDLEAKVYDALSTEPMSAVVHDISDVGISFYAPSSYVPESQQLVVTFSDKLNDKVVKVRVECVIARIGNDNGHIRVGCKISGDNKDYHMYRFMKYLIRKNGRDAGSPENK